VLSTPLAARALAVGDFNGDNKLDLASVTNSCTDPNDLVCNNGFVNILLGNGDGTFQTPVNYPFVGAETGSAAVGDLNLDGKLDLVLANSNCGEFDCPMGSLSVLLGNGDGTLQNAINYFSGDFGANSVVLADLNGDGKLDLALSNLGPCFSSSCEISSISVLLGKGDGNFQAASTTAAATLSANVRSIAVADFNRDGKLDLALSNRSLMLGKANLGKFNSSRNQDIQEVSVKPNTTQIHSGFFGQPAYWNANLYTAAIGDFLKQFGIANGAISVPPQSRSSNTYDIRGATPAVSASGTTGGFVWAVDVSAYPSGPAVLNAYDATNVSTRIYHSPSSGIDAAGKAMKFTVPTVANGKVYIGTQGQLDVYGLLKDRRSVLPGWLWGVIHFSLLAISILTAVALCITLLLKGRRMRQVQS
jgi:hypothetical protein